jgi:hypothetical protein
MLLTQVTVNSRLARAAPSVLQVEAMSDDAELDRLVQALEAKPKAKGRWPDGPVSKTIAKRTQLSPEAPAPRLNHVIAENGPEPTEKALKAWDARVNGESIIDVAHTMGVSLNLARQLINEVHQAIMEDLKESLDLNRTIDLQRLDGLIQAYYQPAREGDDRAASVLLKALQHRAKLTGQEPDQPTRVNNIENVQAWIIHQLPTINSIVDTLPVE